MAEEIEIVNVGGDGNIASEKTLDNLVKAIEKLASKSGLDPKTEGGKIQKEYNKLKKEGIKVSTEHREALEENTDAFKDSTDAVSDFGKGMLGVIGSAFGTIAGSAIGFSNELIQGGDRLEDFTQHLPLVGSYLSGLAGFIDNTFEAFQQLQMTGAAFGNSLTELRVASAELRMGFQEFTQFVSRNSQNFAAFGGTVTDGIRRTRQLNQALGEERERLLAIGFSQEEINETLVNYQYIQRAGARAQQRDARETAMAAAEYAKNLSTLSKLTGQDIDSMRDELAQRSQNIAFQRRLATLEPAERDKILAGLQEAQAIGGDAAANYFQQLFLGMPPLTRETQLFASTMSGAAGSIRNLYRQATDASTSLEEFRNAQPERVVDFVRNSAQNLDQLDTLLRAGAAGMGGTAEEILSIVNGFGIDLAKYYDEQGRLNEEALRADLQAAADRQNRVDAINRAMGAFTNIISDLRITIMHDLIAPLMNTLGPALEEVTDFLKEYLSSPEGIRSIQNITDKIRTFFTNFINNVREDGLMDALGSAFGDAIDGLFGEGGLFYQAIAGLGSVIGSAFVAAITSKEFIAAAAVGLVAYFGALKIGDMIKNALGIGAGGGGSRGGGSADRTPGAGLGKNLGGFIGGLGEGIMKGFAAGLSAFANPKILIGAGIFSGAVLLIGGALAGASWIMGKAMPTLAEGLNSFAEIDGGNLIKVGLGILSVAGGIAAFGVGGVIGSLGTLASEGLDFLGSLFGAESPLEKVIRYAKAFEKIDGKRLQASSQGIMQMSQGLAAFSIVPSGGSIWGWMTGFDPADFAVSIETIADVFEDINGRNLAQASLGVAYMAEALAIFAEGSFNNLGSVVRSFVFDPTQFAENIKTIADVLVEINGRQLAQASLGVAYLAEALSIFNEGSFNNLGSIVRNFMFDPTPLAENIKTISDIFEDINGRNLAQASLGVAYLAEALQIFNEGSFNNLSSIIRNFMFDPIDFATNIKVIADIFEEINGRNLAQASLGVAYLAEALSIFNEGSFNNLSSIIRNFIFDPTQFAENIKTIADIFEEINGRNLAQASLGVMYLAEALSYFNEGSFRDFGAIVRNLTPDPTAMGESISIIAKSFEDINGRQLAQASLGAMYLAEALSYFNESSFRDFGAIVRNLTPDPTPMGESIGKMAFYMKDIDGRQLAEASLGAMYLSEALSYFNEGSFRDFGAIIRNLAPDPTVMGENIAYIASMFEDIDGEALQDASIGVKHMSDALEVFQTSTGFQGLATIASMFTGDSSDIGERIAKIATDLSSVDGAKLSEVSPGIIALSDALEAFGSGAFTSTMESIGSTISKWFTGGDDDIADRIVAMSEKLSVIDGTSLSETASGLGTLSTNIGGLQSTLDTDGVLSYTEAIEGLVEALGKLNDELSKDNDTLLTSRADAGELLSGINGSSQGSNMNLEQLNTAMQTVIDILQAGNDEREKITRHTRALNGNIQRGGAVPQT